MNGRSNQPCGGLVAGRFSRERRTLISLLGGLALASTARPLPLVAQQSNYVRRIAVLMSNPENDPEGQSRLAAFRGGLQELGWVDGRNLSLETRWTGGEMDRVRPLAAELVALAPDLIVANSSPVLSTICQATRVIPVVFVLVNDPLSLGVVDSLQRPGRNATGFTFMELSLIGKWMDMLKQAVPDLSTATLVFGPNMASYFMGYVRSRESSPTGPRLLGALVARPDDYEAVVAGLARQPGASLMIPADSFNLGHLPLIAQLITRFKLPAISIYRQFAVHGGLLAYGPDGVDVFRRAASYVDRILRGANPAELPVQAPIVFKLVVNLKAAGNIGLGVPDNLLALADEVIE